MDYEYCPPIWNEATDNELDLIDLEDLQESEQSKATDRLTMEDYENGFVPLLEDDEEEIYK